MDPAATLTHARRALPRILALAATLGLFLVPAVATAAEKGVVPDMTWGVTPTDQDLTAAALKDTGAKWVRLNMSWYWLDQYPGYWEKYDRAVRLARESGARIVMMFNHSPLWASGSTNIDAPPLLPQLYGDAMRDLVAHYKGQVDAYEIWNEPNHPQFWPSLAGPNAAAYVDLLKAGSKAVRETDPQAQVVFGGVAHSDYKFIEQAYAAEPNLGDYFDAMAVHPYPYPFSASPDEVKYEADGRISPHSFTGYREVRQVMADHGDDRPIWVTEFGWSSASITGGGVGEAKQAEYLTRALEIVESDPYVEMALVYNLRNHYWAADADNWLDSLGMMKVDYTPKPSYDAFKAYEEPVLPPPAEDVPAPAEPTSALQATPETEATEVEIEPREAPETEPPTAADPPEKPLILRIHPLGKKPRAARVALRAGLARISGRIRGASTGRVRIRLLRRARGTQWRQARAVTARVRDGAFRTNVRLKRAARWKLVARSSMPDGSTATGSITFRVLRAR